MRALQLTAPGTLELREVPIPEPWGATVRKSYGGTRSDLYASVALARRGAIGGTVERFDLAEGPAAFERLDQGSIRGRAVLIP